MRLAVLGLGRVGSVVAAGLTEAGHTVFGLDVDKRLVDEIGQGKVPFYEPGLDAMLRQSLVSGLTVGPIQDSGDLDVDAVFVCVGTPSLPSGSADLSAVRSALVFASDKAPGAVVVMKSTLPPGTGAKLARQYLSSDDKELRYVCNPEFLREGQAVHDWLNPDRIVIGGVDAGAIEAVRKVFSNCRAPMLVTDITTAEMVKYAANAFLSTKISFINEIANLCDIVGADIDSVSEGISLDPRIGSSFLKAGIGYGGSCFPKDVRALDFLSALNGYSFDLLKAVVTVNRKQRLLPLQILRRELGDLHGKRIAVLGLAFKPETDDTREAPGPEIVDLLAQEGAEVRSCDCAARPIVQDLPKGVAFSPSAFEALEGAQAMVLCTEWKLFRDLDWGAVHDSMRPPYLVVDGRNALSSDLLQRHGFRYFGIGRGRSTCRG